MAVEWSRKSYSEPAESNLLRCKSIIFQVLFKDWGHRVGSSFNLFVSVLIKGMRRQGEFKIFLCDLRNMGCA